MRITDVEVIEFRTPTYQRPTRWGYSVWLDQPVETIEADLMEVVQWLSHADPHFARFPRRGSRAVSRCAPIRITTRQRRGMTLPARRTG